MTILNMTKSERKKFIKNIEKHLKNFNNYKISISNLKKQLSLVSTKSIQLYSSSSFNTYPSESMIESELRLMETITEAIEQSLTELTDIEKKYVECRYFNK